MPTTTIRHADLVETVAAALQYISYYHPADYIKALTAAYEREQSPAARDAIAQILINSRMCAEGHRPICQDTGIAVTTDSISTASAHRPPPIDAAATIAAQEWFRPNWAEL